MKQKKCNNIGLISIGVAILLVGIIAIAALTQDNAEAHPHDTGEWVQLTKHPQSYEWGGTKRVNNEVYIKLIEYSHHYLSTVVPDMRDENGRYAGDARCGKTSKFIGYYDYGTPQYDDMYAHHLVEFKLGAGRYEVCIPVGTVWEGWVTEGMARDTRKPHPYRTDEPIANDPRAIWALSGKDLNIPTQMFVMDKDYNGLTYNQSNNGYVAVSEVPGACIYIAYAGTGSHNYIPSHTTNCNG